MAEILIAQHWQIHHWPKIRWQRHALPTALLLDPPLTDTTQIEKLTDTEINKYTTDRLPLTETPLFYLYLGIYGIIYEIISCYPLQNVARHSFYFVQTVKYDLFCFCFFLKFLSSFLFVFLISTFNFVRFSLLLFLNSHILMKFVSDDCFFCFIRFLLHCTPPTLFFFICIFFSSYVVL